MNQISSQIEIIGRNILSKQDNLNDYIFDQLSDSIFVIDQDRKFVKMNYSAKLLLLKYGGADTIDELLNKLYAKDYREGEIPKEVVSSNYIINGSNLESSEISTTEEDGAEKHYSIDKIFINEEDIELEIIVLKDITEKVTLENEKNKYKKKAEALENIINTISDGVAIIDVARNYILQNPAFSRIFNDDKIIKKHDLADGFTFEYTKVMDIDGTPIEEKELPIYKVLEGESIVNKICKIEVDGIIKYISFSGTPILGFGGKIEYGVMAFIDVTEIQRHQNYINQQKQFIQNFLDGLAIPVVTIKYPEYRFEIANDQYCKFVEALLGSKVYKRDLIGKTFQQVVPRHYAQAFMADADSVVNLNPQTLPQIIEYKDSNNVIRHYQIVQSPIINEEGEIIYITAVGIEVTEEIKAKKEADDLARMKEEYFTIISHELRSPITVVYSAIQMLTSDLYKREYSFNTQKMLSRIEKNTNRLLALVNNFLDITKAEAGFMNVNYNIINIVSFTETLIESLQPSTLRKSLQLELINECKTETARIDCEKYERILLNLLTNAIKFTEINGQIKLYLAEDDQYLIIKIKDNGVGIPADKISKIFDRFYIVDGSLSRSNNGTGIGLSLVKKLVEIMKGKILVESQVGVGSEFTLYLPKNPS